MSADARYSTVELRGGFVEVDHTPAEVQKMCDEARRRRVGEGKHRLHMRPDFVVLKLRTRAGRADADYRTEIRVNPDMVGTIWPLDERPEPHRVMSVGPTDGFV